MSSCYGTGSSQNVLDEKMAIDVLFVGRVGMAYAYSELGHARCALI
jgi:hypothetical protein